MLFFLFFLNSLPYTFRRQRELDEQEKARKQAEKLQRQEERRRDREDRRREKQAAKRKHEEEEKMNLKLAQDERKLLVTQRKLDSLRLMTELFKNVKVISLCLRMFFLIHINIIAYNQAISEMQQLTFTMFLLHKQ